MRKKAIALITISVLAICGAVVYATTSASSRLVFISGTEYTTGEGGQTIVRVTTAAGIPLSANGCNVTIWYPNKTIWVDTQAMTQGGTAGSWYYTWTAENVTGSYEEYAVCTVGAANKEVGAGSSFHVSEALTTIIANQNEPVAKIIS